VKRLLEDGLCDALLNASSPLQSLDGRMVSDTIPCLEYTLCFLPNDCVVGVGFPIF
jgi:hypothetical protein